MAWRNQRISGYSVASIAARDALTGLNPGDIVVVADDGTGNEATYIWTGNGWLEIVSNPGAPLHLVGTADEVQFSVTGFAGQTANIVELVSDAGTLSYDNAGDLVVPNDITGATLNVPLTNSTASIKQTTDTGNYGIGMAGLGQVEFMYGPTYGRRHFISLTNCTMSPLGGPVFAVTNTGSSLTGTADQVQLLIKGHSTQTNNLFDVVTSTNAEVFRVGTTSMEYNIGAKDYLSVYADGLHVNTEVGYGTAGLWVHYCRSETEGIKFSSNNAASTDATIYRNGASSIIFGDGAAGYATCTGNSFLAAVGLASKAAQTTGFQANHYQNGASLGSAGQYGWTATNPTAVFDTGLERIGAAHVGVTDGGSGVGDFTANTIYSTTGNNDVVISSDEGASGATIAGWANQDSDFSLEPQGWYCFENMSVQNEGMYAFHSGAGSGHIWVIEGYGNDTYGSFFGQESATDPLCVASVEQGTYGAALVASSSGGYSTAGYQIEDIGTTPHTLNTSTNYSTTDINKVITNTAASTVDIVQNLPASAGTGRVYNFIQTDGTYKIDIKPNGTDLVYVGTSVSTATTGKVTSNGRGSAITLVDAESGVWYALSSTGSWTVT